MRCAIAGMSRVARSLPIRCSSVHSHARLSSSPSRQTLTEAPVAARRRGGRPRVHAIGRSPRTRFRLVGIGSRSIAEAIRSG